jgi:hypothetical protein
MSMSRHRGILLGTVDEPLIGLSASLPSNAETELVAGRVIGRTSTFWARGSRFSARIGPFPGYALRPFAPHDPPNNLNDNEHNQGAHSGRSHDQPG